MSTRIAAIMLLALGATTAQAQAQNAPRSSLSLQPGSTLRVDGNSTVRSYRCEAEVMTGTVSTAATSLRIDRVANDVANATLSIEVDRLECGNGTMNGHMKRALKQDAHPRIEFRMKQIAVENGVARMWGDLSIAGQAHPVMVEGTIVEEAGGALRVAGSYGLNMTEFGVAPPRLMAGTMRVHDPVTVSFDVVFRP